MELIEKDNIISKNEILISDDDNFPHKLVSLIEKKSNEIIASDKTIPKKVEFIHNDVNDDILDNSFCPIIWSSFLLIINDVVIKWIFSRNEIFDYFF